MSYKPCQRCFVQVVDLLPALRDEKLSPRVAAKAGALAVSLIVVGEYLTAKEIQKLEEGK